MICDCVGGMIGIQQGDQNVDVEEQAQASNILFFPEALHVIVGNWIAGRGNDGCAEIGPVLQAEALPSQIRG